MNFTVSPGAPRQLGDARRVVEAAAAAAVGAEDEPREHEGGEKEQGERRRHEDGWKSTAEAIVSVCYILATFSIKKSGRSVRREEVGW